MQFGRIDHNAYTLDFQYPFSAVQAFAVALANVTQRLKWSWILPAYICQLAIFWLVWSSQFLGLIETCFQNDCSFVVFLYTREYTSCGIQQIKSGYIPDPDFRKMIVILEL